MARRLEEFYCDVGGGGCGQYFKTYLRDNFWGNYTIECPNPDCKHHHFRVIDKGLVTSDRHQDRLGTAQVIVGLRSTLSKTPYHDDPEFRRSQLRVYANNTGG
jgi:hypothetical protein